MDKSEQLDELVESVEALLAQIPHNAVPGIVALREELDQAIFKTWTAVARERAESRTVVDELAESLSDVVRANRWMILGAVVAVAATAGFVTARARRSTFRTRLTLR